MKKTVSFCIIRERAELDHKYYWNIIKGSFEPGNDKDFFEAAEREAKEEANALIKIKNLLNILYLEKHNRSFIQFNFLADLISSHFALSSRREQKKYRRGEDIIDIKLFSKNELKKMKKKSLLARELMYQFRIG